ncbi:DUF1259 domain-containing protein [Streptomyces sp. NBC_00820]|uniref:DUF1259 domain-containing protein n=1 Tax=Streptomyces sp. NBC_00820 TaxID=2975842 RepID=UPI002ED407F7|nr:DUF1259 domain-containing protein [Streptomyces sp. NBC_00820]
MRAGREFRRGGCTAIECAFAALRRGGFEVAEAHGHNLTDEPCLLFVHHRAVGDTACTADDCVALWTPPISYPSPEELAYAQRQKRSHLSV